MIYLLNQTNLQIYNIYKLLDKKPKDIESLQQVEGHKWNDKFDKKFQFLSENLDLKQIHRRLSKIIFAVVKKVVKKGKLSMVVVIKKKIEISIGHFFVHQKNVKLFSFFLPHGIRSRIAISYRL